MVIFNVTTHVESSIEKSWLNWMKEKHIPEMLATKKFKAARIFKIISENDKGGVSYAAQYQCDDKKSLEQHLDDHGSLNFSYLSQMLTEEDTEELLKRFHQTNTRKTDTNHVLTEMTLRKIEDTSSKSSFKRSSKEEKRIQSCNTLDKSIWQELLKDCLIWEYETAFTDLLEKISKPRTKITKKDSPFFISQIEDLLSRNYLNAFKYESIHKIFS